MKKAIAFVLAVITAFAVVGCSGVREGVDISGAKTLADLKGATIAAQAGSFHVTAIDQIENVNSKTYPKTDDLLPALKSGAIDGFVVEEPSAISFCMRDDTLGYVHLKNNDTGFTANASEVGIAVGVKEGSELRDKINEVLSTITEEQRKALMEEIISLRNGGDVKAFSVSSSKTDTSNGTLKVAMECDYEPFNWTEMSGDALGAHPITSEANNGLYANGFDVQIAKYIAAELGMKLEIYAVKWASIIPAVKAGTVDAIIAGMSPTAEREKEIDFSNTYYESDLVVVYKKK